MKIWHNLWKCPDETPYAKHYDMTIVAFSATILAIIVGLFYSGSYIQIEHAQRNLIRCKVSFNYVVYTLSFQTHEFKHRVDNAVDWYLLLQSI